MASAWPDAQAKAILPVQPLAHHGCNTGIACVHRSARSPATQWPGPISADHLTQAVRRRRSPAPQNICRPCSGYRGDEGLPTWIVLHQPNKFFLRESHGRLDDQRPLRQAQRPHRSSKPLAELGCTVVAQSSSRSSPAINAASVIQRLSPGSDPPKGREKSSNKC